MSVPQVNGVSMTTKRRHAIFALYRLGGTLETPAGRKYIPSGLAVSKLNMGTGSLAHMERDGIVVRDMHGKSTRSIALTPEWMQWAEEQGPQKRGPYKRTSKRTTKRTAKRAPAVRHGHGKMDVSTDIPLPPIGTTLTVFMLQADQDGTINVGLRNGTTSWLVAMKGHAESAVRR